VGPREKFCGNVSITHGTPIANVACAEVINNSLLVASTKNSHLRKPTMPNVYSTSIFVGISFDASTKCCLLLDELDLMRLL